MNACGVERQPPRLPTRISRADGTVLQHCSVDQIVDHHHIRVAQGAHGLERQQFRVTGTRTHQPDLSLIVFSSRDYGDRLRGGRQQSLDFRDAGTAVACRSPMCFSPCRSSPRADAAVQPACWLTFLQLHTILLPHPGCRRRPAPRSSGASNQRRSCSSARPVSQRLSTSLGRGFRRPSRMAVMRPFRCARACQWRAAGRRRPASAPG